MTAKSPAWVGRQASEGCRAQFQTGEHGQRYQGLVERVVTNALRLLVKAHWRNALHPIISLIQGLLMTDPCKTKGPIPLK